MTPYYPFIGPTGPRYLRPRDVIAARERQHTRDKVRADLDRACAADDIATALACEDALVRSGMDPADRRTSGRCGWWADHAHPARDDWADDWATVGGQSGHMRARDIRDALIVFDRAATATAWTPCPGGAWTEITRGDTTFTVVLVDEPVCAAFIVDRVRGERRDYTPALNVWLDTRAWAIAEAYHNTPATGSRTRLAGDEDPS
ncbi:hypothetical protein GZH49_12680 [Nocardia terpenica]|uniref:hypothetical protein n=1 Tax=Nocardia terpenica TaxID=455432 RepID=UPI002FE28D26